MTCLLDSNVLYALADKDQVKHEITLKWLRKPGEVTLVPDFCLTEVLFMLSKYHDTLVAASFLKSLFESKLKLEIATLEDLKRAADLMAAYADARLDFVDAVMMAMAERKRITRIATYDHRHFLLVRPKHCAHFELLP